MSGKYEKQKNKKKKRSGLLIVLIVLLILALLAALVGLGSKTDNDKKPNDEEQNTETTVETEVPVVQIDTAKMHIPVKYGLEIVDIGPYTGIYMEDGSDELVSGVLMVMVTNNGEDAVEYAKITMTVNAEPAEFTLTTLKPGDTVVLLEKNRMQFDKSLDYTTAEINCENYAVFQAEPELHEDKLKIQILDGAINVINISGEDIDGRIAIYYKNKADDVYYGGITYRIVIDNGLKADEIRQMVASHFSDTGSEIVFVTIAP